MEKNRLEVRIMELLKPYAPLRFSLGINSVQVLAIDDLKLLDNFFYHPPTKKATRTERPRCPSGRITIPQYEYRTRMWDYLREGWNLHLRGYDRATIPLLEATANYLEQKGRLKKK